MAREKFNAACQMQAEACDALGSPFTAHLCRLMATHRFAAEKLEARLGAWPGDISYRGHSVPLRLCGALNALVRSGKAPALAALYPPHQPARSDARFWQVLDRAVADFEEQILAQLECAPQTNEVRRASALMPALLHLAAQYPLPICLYEMGASAGLNLALDQFACQFADQHYGPPDAPFTLRPDWQGPPPPHPHLQIVARHGCDLNPLDVRKAADAERLLAYIWPDQADRVTRTQKAIAEVRRLDIRLDQQDAADWLETRMDARAENRLHVVFNTVAFQYFPPEVQQKIRSLMVRAGRNASARNPLVWLQLEADEANPGFALTRQCWPGGAMVELGRADAHGRWVNWHSTPKPVPH